MNKGKNLVFNKAPGTYIIIFSVHIRASWDFGRGFLESRTVTRMVRVMSIHHFAGQDIRTCEDPLAVAIAPPNLLLLALAQHVVEVRDLSKGSLVVSTFPTVDEVQRLIHCCTGNYVATLESKHTRQGKESIYARIYANWDTSSQYDFTMQPMRARIAGRVTPSIAQSGIGLEMIELPVKRTPNAVACCQITGNLILSSKRNLTLYCFHARTHDISRLKFIDFEESHICLEMSFVPFKLELCEDVIACMSREYVHVLQICDHADICSKKEEARECSDQYPGSNEHNQDPLDWDKVCKNEKLRKPVKSSIVTAPIGDDIDRQEISLLAFLPGIIPKKSDDLCSDTHSTPFIPAVLGVTRHTSLPMDSAVENKIIHLLQLQLPSSEKAAGVNLGHANDHFQCLLLKPIYTGHTNSSDKIDTDHLQGHPLRSVYKKMLRGIICFITTHQEGYLYYYSFSSESTADQQLTCVTVYPFTAPVLSVVLEDYLLHALTHTGLETYTLRMGHFLPTYKGEEAHVIPEWADPVCLVGLRPFLGVEYILLAESYLLLLACPESSSNNSLDLQGCNWTLYSLEIPNPITLYNDIMSFGEVHKWTSRSTYSHLLGECHLILHVSLVALHWIPHNELAKPYWHLNCRSEMEDLFRESCALLGDYNLLGSAEEDWDTAIKYYEFSGLTPIQVVERIKAIQIPEDLGSAVKENQVKGLMKYMKYCLLYMKWAESNENFTPAIPCFTNYVLDLFEEHDPDQVSWLILKSSLLREYATDRVLNIMKKQLCTRLLPKLSDAVALVLLCIQKGSIGQAVTVLHSLPEEQLSSILLANSSLLFEMSPIAPNTRTSFIGIWRNETVTAFSELSVVVMDTKPIVLANILAAIVTSEKNISLHDVLKVFMEHLPSRIGIRGSTAGLVLQIFLEKFFSWYFAYPVKSFDAPTVEALKILVRSYLSDLQRYDVHNSGQEIDNTETQTLYYQKSNVTCKPNCEQTKLFIDRRLPFLQKMPPFALNLSKNASHILCKKDNRSTSHVESTQSTESLIKLQALLCSGHLPKECLLEVYQFVQSHPQLYGNLSLQVLCLPAREGANVLMNFCPQVVLQFAKNKFAVQIEWKYLMLLLQRKTYALPTENALKPLYKQVMKDCLYFLSTTMAVEDFCRVLPPGTESSYDCFLHICQQVNHAHHILTLIIATGHQLLNTLHI